MSEPLPVLEAQLGPDEIDALFDDLSALTTMEWVQAELVGPEGPVPRRAVLEDAHAWIREGRARRVLLRYRHDGATWCDTLFAEPPGARLVRVEMQDA